MATPLKEMYNKDFINELSHYCSLHISDFNSNLFSLNIFNKNWKNLELKERIKHIAFCLNSQIKTSTPEALKTVANISENISTSLQKEDTFEYIVLADYVEVYGTEHPEASFAAMEKITVLASCEFAIRPFILKYPEKSFEQLNIWSKHKHASVRRLSSEGCRPRLPWGMGLAPLKKDPTAIFPILEHLKDDSSLYVRRSVANNLNDISKDHPQKIIELLSLWNGKSAERNWLVKHAARTLLKQGNPEILTLFGYGDRKKLEVKNFNIKNPIVTIGEALAFEFSVTNKSTSTQKIRLEYFIHFLLANGKLSKKIYKISERELQPLETLNYERKQSFKIISTRKYYPGTHQITLVINGIEEDNAILFNLK